jgi:hypothetical protein
MLPQATGCHAGPLPCEIVPDIDHVVGQLRQHPHARELPRCPGVGRAAVEQADDVGQALSAPGPCDRPHLNVLAVGFRGTPGLRASPVVAAGSEQWKEVWPLEVRACYPYEHMG